MVAIAMSSLSFLVLHFNFSMVFFYQVNTHAAHQYIPPPQPSPRQQYSPRTTVLYPAQPRAPSVNSNYPANEMYTPLPRADIKPYHESYFSDIKPQSVAEPEPRSNFVAEGLAASLQARVLLAPPIKEEVEVVDRRTSFIQQNILPNMVPYPEQQNNTIKVESNKIVYERESTIHGPIRSVPKGNSSYIVEPQRNNFVTRSSPDVHPNSSVPIPEEVHEQPPHTRPRKCNDEGKLNLI